VERVYKKLAAREQRRQLCDGDYENMKFPRDNFLARGQAHFETDGLSKLKSWLRSTKARSSFSVHPADLLGYLRSSVVTVKRDLDPELERRGSTTSSVVNNMRLRPPNKNIVLVSLPISLHDQK
jgi:hypothetical protein